MIEVKNLTKNYGDFEAIKDISFNIEKGEIVGFLGPNGAGKSTTMNIITGYIEPTSGSVIVNGFDISKRPKKVKKQIGYMPENVPLYTDLTVKEFVNYMADLKLIKRKEKKDEVKRILKEVGLEEVQNKLIKNISRGYRQRVSMAGALVGNPPILILDEPTVGLDPKQVTEIRNLIKSLGENHTVILSSHILSEVSQMCNKIIILNEGKIVKIDTTENIEQVGADNSNIITLIVEDENDKINDVVKGIKSIQKFEFVTKNSDNSKVYKVISDNKDDIRKVIFKEFAKHDITIIEMKKEETSLEDAFLKLTEKNKKGGK